MRPRILVCLSLLLGIASVILGFALLAHAGYIAAYFGFLKDDLNPSNTWRRLVHEVTKPVPMAYLVGWVGLAALLGGLGLWLARRGRGEGGRLSLAASAARFSILGLVGAGLDAAILAVLLGCRWYWWG
jgi:hypothetical protein